jgi:hypothetical protein
MLCRKAIFPSKVQKGGPMEEEERLEALAGGFKRLNDEGKNRIRELTRRLAELHCPVEGEVYKTAASMRTQRNILGLIRPCGRKS